MLRLRISSGEGAAGSGSGKGTARGAGTGGLVTQAPRDKTSNTTKMRRRSIDGKPIPYCCFFATQPSLYCHSDEPPLTAAVRNIPTADCNDFLL